MKKITVVIPCYNEEDGIAAVIKNFSCILSCSKGYTLDVLVVDNGSKDKTAEVARAAGARVIEEPQQGKGNAIRAAFYNINEDTDYVVMCSGDGAYEGCEIKRMLEPLESGFCQAVLGSRLGGKIVQNAMPRANRAANWGFSFLVRLLYGVNVTDTLTGYYAWNRDVVVRLRQYLRSSGYSIEMEMVTCMARMGVEMYSVPITYSPHPDRTVRLVQDGFGILGEFVRRLRWHPPMERIAFVTDTVWPYFKGGKEKRLHEISTRLVRDGRQVDIYTMKWWDGPKTITMPNGLHLHGISKKRNVYNGFRRRILPAVLFAGSCFKIIFRRFDVIDVDSMPFFPMFPVRIVTWIRRKKMHATWHEVWGTEYWRDYLGGLGGYFGAFTEWLAMKTPDVVISNSDHTTKRLMQAGMKRKIVTVPLGVDLDTLFAVAPHEQESDVIFAGRLLAHKNVELLVRAVKLVKRSKPDLRCLIVGSGPERERLESLVAELKLQKNITFYNFLEDHNELYALMKSSKMFVLPSVREGFSLVSIEANACGLPVVTTRHEQNAARDLIIEGRNGYLADPEVKHLAAQMRMVLRARGELDARKTMQESFPQYNWNYAAQSVERILGGAKL